MKESVSVAQMRRRRAVLARRMARHGQLMRGTVSMRSTRARREGEAPVAGRWRGPYLYIVVSYQGRRRSVYVPGHLAQEVRRWVENAQALEQDLEEITWLNARLLRAESAARRTKGRS